MREILFRGKRQINGEWVWGIPCESVIIHDVTYDCYGQPKALMYPVIFGTIGQYTGLRDRNGMQIFDGDIIRYTTKERSSIYGVCWNAEAACFVVYSSALGKGKPIGDFTFFDSQKCEVIGNIFDNPELLKGGESNG